MKFLSLFSGIEACSVAWEPLGWECVGFSEIEPFPCSLLTHHYPHVPNLGDVTKITEYQISELDDFDILVFGSPCTDLSVAGRGEGLYGSQSILFYHAMRVFEYARKHNKCRFALWENVPGAFSSNKGDDFTEVVREMAGLDHVTTPKYKWGKEGAALGSKGLLEWSVLDAQFFGLAQRRKRVFAILDTGDWESRPPILLERESLRGDSPPSRKTRENTTSTTGERLASGGDVTGTIMANCGDKQWLGNQEAFSGQYHVVSYSMIADTTPKIGEEVCGTLRANGGGGIVPPSVGVIAGNVIGRDPKHGGNQLGVYEGHTSPTLTATDKHAVITQSVIRRFTPVECERLMGFEDNYTLVPHNGKLSTDTVRYKALGNSMAVPVMRWIGKKIMEATK